MSYIDKPQLLVERVGKIFKFKLKGQNKQQFYLQDYIMRRLVFGGGYAYANEYIPHKTLKTLNNQNTNPKTKD